MEEEIDKLIAEIEFDDIDQPLSTQPHPSTSSAKQSHPLTLSGKQRFGSLKIDEEVEAAKKSAIPKNTERNTVWAVKVWKDWSASRQKSCPGQSREWPVHPYLAPPQQLNYWLCKFILEARKRMGTATHQTLCIPYAANC